MYKVVLTGQHVDVSTVRYGEDVGWHFITSLATVQFGTPKRVDRETLVRVDGHAEETRVCLQKSSKHCYTDGDREQWMGSWGLSYKEQLFYISMLPHFPYKAHKKLR
jgi:hypothetical protein